MSVSERRDRALYLHVQLGWPIKRIAPELGVSERQVKRYLSDLRRITGAPTSGAAYAARTPVFVRPRRRRVQIADGLRERGA